MIEMAICIFASMQRIGRPIRFNLTEDAVNVTAKMGRCYMTAKQFLVKVVENTNS